MNSDAIQAKIAADAAALAADTGAVQDAIAAWQDPAGVVLPARWPYRTGPSSTSWPRPPAWEPYRSGSGHSPASGGASVLPTPAPPWGPGRGS